MFLLCRAARANIFGQWKKFFQRKFKTTTQSTSTTQHSMQCEIWFDSKIALKKLPFGNAEHYFYKQLGKRTFSYLLNPVDVQNREFLSSRLLNTISVQCSPQDCCFICTLKTEELKNKDNEHFCAKWLFKFSRLDTTQDFGVVGPGLQLNFVILTH